MFGWVELCHTFQKTANGIANARVLSEMEIQLTICTREFHVEQADVSDDIDPGKHS